MDDLLPDLTLAFNETFQMLSISTVLAIIGGLPLGFLIFVTDRHLFWQNRFVYLLSSVLVNIIRSVPFVILLVLLLPWNAYQAGQSPFVTFFSKLGVPYVGSIMNIVVLTAALSSLNSGLYSTGRILRSMSMGGSAPKFMSKMSKQHVPYAGILATLVVYVFGVFLNYLVPSQVFEIVLNVAALGIIASWGFIVVCQMRLRKAIKEGKAAKVSFRMPGAPFTSWLTLLFLFSVLVLMAFDYPNGTYTIGSIPLLAVLLVAGWFGVRKRVHEIHSTAPTLRK